MTLRQHLISLYLTARPPCCRQEQEDPLETDSGSESRDSVSRSAEGGGGAAGGAGGARGGQDTPSAKSEREDEPDSEQDDLAAATGQWGGADGVPVGRGTLCAR